MKSTSLNPEVEKWLREMIGRIIHVMIIEKSSGATPQEVVWKGKGKVLRCVQDGAVLDLNCGNGSWWSRFFRNWHVIHVASSWIKKPVSIPYFDLSIHRDSITGEKQLVIDAATWKRSPEELAGKGNFLGIS